MTLQRFFNGRDGLPDPKGPLSSTIISESITLANREAKNVIRRKEGEKAWSIFKVGTSKHRKPSLHLYFILFAGLIIRLILYLNLVVVLT